MDEKIEILLFEDNPGDAYLIEEMLEEFTDFSYELKNVETLNEGLSLLKERSFDVILSDLGLPDSDGIDTFLDIYAINSRIPIIILTGFNDEKIGIDALKKGAQDYLVKGQVDGRLLKRSIRYSIERKKAQEVLTNIEIARKKEIHHRIKNNLQVISSLLDLQAEQFRNRECIKDSEVLEAFRESQDRVISMALIHEELYKGGEFETLNFSMYVEELAEKLLQTYRLGNSDINLKLNLAKNVFFDMDTAVPLGIIINELITNSFKHAFIGRDKGEIRIELLREENGEYIESIYEDCNTIFILSISDNGVGIPEFDFEDIDSLGMQLVSSLVDQLDGEFELKRDNGTEFTMRFTVTEKNNQASSPALQQLIE
jgi:two-component sensor histidine kinase